MTYDQSSGTTSLRAEFVDSAIKAIARKQYKFIQALNVVPTSSWKNTYYREDPQLLTAAGGLSSKVPRGAQPAQGAPGFERNTAYIEKFFYEGSVLWEDILADEISVESRTLYKVAEKITSDVDAAIWSILGENATATTTTTTAIQLVTIAQGKHWSGSSAAIIDDIHAALAAIASSNYSTENCMMFINPRDRRSIMRWLSDKGTQFPQVGNDVAVNGFVGKLAGVDLVVANTVPASHALVLVPKLCGSWREAVSLRTTTIEDPYVGLKIRAVQEGVTTLEAPNAVVLISNTRGNDS